MSEFQLRFKVICQDTWRSAAWLVASAERVCWGNPCHVFLKKKKARKPKSGVSGLFNLGAKLSDEAIKLKKQT